MTCATIAAIVGAASIQMGGDTLVLAPHPNAMAQVCYSNTSGMASLSGNYEIALNGLRLTVRLEVTPAEETISFEIPGEYQALPADANPATVADGETVKFLIIYPSS